MTEPGNIITVTRTIIAVASNVTGVIQTTITTARNITAVTQITISSAIDVITTVNCCQPNFSKYL